MNMSPLVLKARPFGLHGEGMLPTTVAVPSEIENRHTEQGDPARPAAYRLPVPSAVSPSMTSGVLETVVKVICEAAGNPARVLVGVVVLASVAEGVSAWAASDIGQEASMVSVD